MGNLLGNIIKRQFEDTIKESTSMADAARKLDIPYSTFKRQCIQLGLWRKNQGRQGMVGLGGPERIILEDVFSGKHKAKIQNARLREMLIAQGYLERKCATCGNEGEWKGETLILDLDHVNGNTEDNRLENLRILCPNCHRITPTWGRQKEFEIIEDDGTLTHSGNNIEVHTYPGTSKKNLGKVMSNITLFIWREEGATWYKIMDRVLLNNAEALKIAKDIGRKYKVYKIYNRNK